MRPPDENATGEVWTLAGYERVTSGALQQEYFPGQSWLVTPAPLEDLRKAEAEWARLATILDSKSSVASPQTLLHRPPRECELDVGRLPAIITLLVGLHANTSHALSPNSSA